MTYVSIPDTLADIREQLVKEFQDESIKYNRMEDEYSNPDTPHEICAETRNKLKTMCKDLENRKKAIQYFDMALCLISHGEYDSYFDGNY